MQLEAMHSESYIFFSSGISNRRLVANPIFDRCHRRRTREWAARCVRSVTRLPPATSKAPFIVVPSVANDFNFRVLRMNRRVVVGTEDRKEELEDFHQVLTDISWGRASPLVRDFIIQAYVKGARTGSADRSELEGSTSVFAKRRCVNCFV